MATQGRKPRVPIETLIELRKEGLTIQAVADKVSLGPSTVSERLQRYETKSGARTRRRGAARRNKRRATAGRIFLFTRAFACLFGAARIAQVYDMDDWRVSGVVILLALAGVVSAWEAVLRAAAVKQ